MNARSYVGELQEEFQQRIRSHRPRTRGLNRNSFQQLAETVLKRTDDRALVDYSPTTWLAHVEELLAFVDQRTEGEALVSVSPPRTDALDGSTRSLVLTCMADQPFIVDTLRLAFDQDEVQVFSQINVILPVRRTRKGKLKGIQWDSDDHRLESVTLFEISPIESKEDRHSLEQDITSRMLQGRAMVMDFPRMLREVKTLANEYEYLKTTTDLPTDQLNEVQDYLQWLVDDNFVFMGLSFSPSSPKGGKPLKFGVFRFREGPVLPGDPEGRAFVKAGGKRGLILVHKTTEESEVHRPGKIDEILVCKFDDRGNCVGCLTIHGLFTFRAIHTQGSSVPLLRRKLDRVVELEEVVEGTYNYKGVVNAFDSLPVEYLFTATPEDIRALVRRTLAAERALRVEVHLALNPPQRSGFLFVVMPRQHFGDDVRARIQEQLVARLGISYVDHRVFIGNYGMAVLHFYFTSSGPFPKIDPEEFEADLLKYARSWQDRFRDALLRELPRDQAVHWYRIYNAAFSPRYEVSTTGEQAVVDCGHLEFIREDGGLAFDVYRDAEDDEQATAKLRIYEGTNLFLTDILPILDNFGLNVANSFANRVRPSGGNKLYLDTFRFEIPDGDLDALMAMKENLLSALSLVFQGQLANDRLNRVLLPAQLAPREVDLLRSYVGYSRQLGSTMRPTTVWRTMVRHSDLVRLLVQWFEAKFGPDRAGKMAPRPSTTRLGKSRELRDEIYHRIDGIQSYSEDRILRTFANLIDATLRTSFFSKQDHFAHKIDCTQVMDMKAPRPWREIYVHHATMEGVHLRGGPVARGGLRWSDRPDDYRTEILGLMTTQMVKNVVIVPLGAKGGFVVRRPAIDPAERRAQADRLYVVFINGLLDVTDNLIDSEPVPPKDIVCYDEPDPYFVVAADKGTAHLSDTANAISERRGFWLGDAFASGGSNGYDHKVVGITARGAWVDIRHHFRELGIDPGKDTFTAAGIGDMGGDVFGNGMIEHATTKLLAAFNHAHIFIDPDPDPKISFAERKRLFKARYGGWDAYDTKKISKGGGVYDRQAKSIPLSAAALSLLGIEAAKPSANDVIRAILKLDVDLLYNGGIGTYVKASQQPDSEAQDPGNASVRVDADELRARVVGEGGNLGLTQAARIEYAWRGGRINTDFIDNAGGVNMSDHEVNLKILLKGALDAGTLALKSRNKLLRDLEPTVTDVVLEANGSQVLMLSLDERRSTSDLASFDRLIDEVCRAFAVKRTDLGLPGIKVIGERIKAGAGLERPELAVLSSYMKMLVYRDLVADPDVDMEGLRPYLHNYFPDQIKKRFGKLIDAHPLGREIALTRLTNRIVDQAGATFFSDMAYDASADLVHAVGAYTMASRAADAWVIKDKIYALGGKISADIRYRSLLFIEAALRAASLHIVDAWSTDKLRRNLRASVPYARRLGKLSSGFLEFLDPISVDTALEIRDHLASEGFPKALASQVAASRYLPYEMVILDLADQDERPPRVVADDYFSLGRASNIFASVEELDGKSAEEYYESLARRAQRRELFDLLARLVTRLGKVKGSAEEKLNSLGSGREAFDSLAEISPEELGAASLMVATDRIRGVLR